jgi:hypothetical protein
MDLRSPPCETNVRKTKDFFEQSSKRRKGYPSEARVKRGRQVVGGCKELRRKIGPKRFVSLRFRTQVSSVAACTADALTAATETTFFRESMAQKSEAQKSENQEAS